MSLPPVVADIANFVIPASIFAILALALNVQWGKTGLFNAGIAGFWAIGAYATAILVTGPAPASPQYPGHLGGFGQSFLVAAPVAMLLAGLAGLLIALPILRLRTDYFAIATLALAEIIRLVFANAASFTAGTIGIISIPRPFDPFIQRDPELSDLSMAGIAAALLLIAYLVLEYLTRAPWGRVLRGIREDEEATLALGKNVFSFRLQAFVIGCAVMGLAGAVFATFLRIIVPNQFDPLATFTIYVMLILGGSGNNRGVVFGAFLFYTFDWVSVRLKDHLPEDIQEKVPALRLMAIGVILVLLVLYRPEGIFPEAKRTYPPAA